MVDYGNILLVLFAIFGPWMFRQVYEQWIVFLNVPPDNAHGLTTAEQLELERELQERFKQWRATVDRNTKHLHIHGGSSSSSRSPNFDKSVQENIRNRLYREHFVKQQGPSFPLGPEHFRLARDGPIRTRWDRNIDDIGKYMMEMNMGELDP